VLGVGECQHSDVALPQPTPVIFKVTEHGSKQNVLFKFEESGAQYQLRGSAVESVKALLDSIFPVQVPGQISSRELDRDSESSDEDMDEAFFLLSDQQSLLHNEGVQTAVAQSNGAAPTPLAVAPVSSGSKRKPASSGGGHAKAKKLKVKGQPLLASTGINDVPAEAVDKKAADAPSVQQVAPGVSEQLRHMLCMCRRLSLGPWPLLVLVPLNPLPMVR